MSMQNPRVFPVTWATGSTFSNQVDLGGGYLYIALEIPSNTAFSGVTPYWICVANTGTGGTFRRYCEPLTSTVTNDFSIASSVSNRVIGIPYLGNRYIKIEVSGTATTPASGFNIICTDSL